MEIKWRYVEQLKDVSLIEDYEKLINYKFPTDFKSCVLKYNGGSPSLESFDTDKIANREFSALLSFNKEDDDNIWTTLEYFPDDFFSTYVPFAIDGFGNFICFNKNDAIVFWNHESNNIEFIVDNFSKFLDNLHG